MKKALLSIGNKENITEKAGIIHVKESVNILPETEIIDNILRELKAHK